MARKKQEIQLQQEIETQEEWEDVMGKEGLFVIDVYQDWCGPCAGMTGNFKKIKNEIGDQLLHFAKAKCDTVDSLEKYRGHCEPCFLFYAGGVLVSVVRGANAPLIMRTITEQLAHEHKVVDGQAERKEIKDPFISQLDSQEQLAPEDEEQEEEEAAAPGSSRKVTADKQMMFKGEIIGDVDTLEPRKQGEGKKEVTVALIKPDAVQAGKVDEILADIKAAGIEVLKQEERTMTEDEVRNFYTHLQDEEYFNDLVNFMTSGPSYILVLTKGATGQNIINEFRDLIGPTSVEDAKEANPESLRAKHGSEKFMNALHGSSSEEQAHRELAFFFPDYALPAVEGKPKLQRTLALVRPDAFKLHRDEILQRITEAGFRVALQKEMTLTKEMAEDFYKEHEGQEYFEELTTRMSSGPLLALGLAREEAVQGWRDMLGPKEVDKAKEESPESLRAQFAVDDVMINQLHGSDSEESAKRELEYFFPMQQTVAVIKPNAIGTKDEIIEKIHDAGFRIAARKETTLSREIAEEFYSDHKEKEYYNDLVDHMTSGPTYFMVLSREDAVEGWRSIIGPTDPAKAKEENPESLRALYGESILQNAVHGSSNPEHAKQAMEKIFEGEAEQEESQVAETQQQETEGGGEVKPEEQTEQQEGEQTQEQTQQQTTEEENKEQTPTQEQAAEDQGQIPEGQTTDQTNQDEAEVTQQAAESAGQDHQLNETATEEDETQNKDTEEKPAEAPEAPAQEEAKEEEKPAEQQSEEKPPEEKPEETQQEAAVSRQGTDVQDVAPESKEEETAQEEEKPKEEAQTEEPPKEEEKKEEEPETKEEESKEETAEQKTEETAKEETAQETAQEETKEEETKEEQKPSEGEEEQKPAEPEQKPEGEEEKKEEAKPDEG